MTTTSGGDELRMLRERAYGPDADIQDDAAAVARLRQLEGRPANAAEEPPAETEPQAEAARLTSEPEVARPAPVPGGPATVRPRRRTAVLWAASVAVAAVAGFGVARLAADARPNPLATARQIAVLAPDPSVPVPSLLVSEGQAPAVTMRQDFLGLRTVVGEPGWGAPQADGRCVWIVPAADADSSGTLAYAGSTFYACGAGRFPATVAFTVADDSPAELRQAYPAGTSLQFVLDAGADDVVVYADR